MPRSKAAPAPHTPITVSSLRTAINENGEGTTQAIGLRSTRPFESLLHRTKRIAGRVRDTVYVGEDDVPRFVATSAAQLQRATLPSAWPVTKAGVSLVRSTRGSEPTGIAAAHVARRRGVWLSRAPHHAQLLAALGRSSAFAAKCTVHIHTRWPWHPTSTTRSVRFAGLGTRISVSTAVIDAPELHDSSGGRTVRAICHSEKSAAPPPAPLVGRTRFTLPSCIATAATAPRSSASTAETSTARAAAARSAPTTFDKSTSAVLTPVPPALIAQRCSATPPSATASATPLRSNVASAPPIGWCTPFPTAASGSATVPVRTKGCELLRLESGALRSHVTRAHMTSDAVPAESAQRCAETTTALRFGSARLQRHCSSTALLLLLLRREKMGSGIAWRPQSVAESAQFRRRESPSTLHTVKRGVSSFCCTIAIHCRLTLAGL